MWSSLLCPIWIFLPGHRLKVRDLSLRWENGQQVLHGISFSAPAGQIIGVTGAVASGKSMLGKALLGELPYEGSIEVDERELRTLSLYERSRLLSYLGHEPELMTESIEENIRLVKKAK
jgi:ATP-binding cassette subfamily B protein